MKEKLIRTYRADKKPDGLWTVFRVITARTGPWYWRTGTTSEVRLGKTLLESEIRDIIKQDIIYLSPEQIIDTNKYDSLGRSTNYYGW